MPAGLCRIVPIVSPYSPSPTFHRYLCPPERWPVLQITGFMNPGSVALLANLCGSSLRRHHAPYSVESTHIEGQRLELPVISSPRAICKPIKVHKPIHIVPSPLVVGVEDVCTVLVDMDTTDVLCVQLPAICGRLSTTSTDLPSTFICQASTAPYRPAPTIR